MSMTRAEAQERLRKIQRALQSNPGYCEPMSELEIEGWLELLEALQLLKEDADV